MASGLAGRARRAALRCVALRRGVASGLAWRGRRRVRFAAMCLLVHIHHVAKGLLRSGRGYTHRTGSALGAARWATRCAALGTALGTARGATGSAALGTALWRAREASKVCQLPAHHVVNLLLPCMHHCFRCNAHQLLLRCLCAPQRVAHHLRQTCKDLIQRANLEHTIDPGQCIENGSAVGTLGKIEKVLDLGSGIAQHGSDVLKQFLHHIPNAPRPARERRSRMHVHRHGLARFHGILHVCRGGDRQLREL